jgi:hypothetical protein
MATVFKNKLYSELGTSNTTVLETLSNAKTTVIGLSLTNLTGSIVLGSVKIVDTINSTSAYYVKDVLIPPNQSLRVVNGGERLVLGPSTQVNIQSNTDNALDLVLSYVEII